jgi:hypothetical protein
MKKWSNTFLYFTIINNFSTKKSSNKTEQVHPHHLNKLGTMIKVSYSRPLTDAENIWKLVPLKSSKTGASDCLQ